MRAKVITLWNKFTSKHKGCQVPHIYKFTLRYVDGYKQFEIHDCGLFTLKAIEYWDGHNLPNLMELDELKLRKLVVAERFHSPVSKLQHKTVFPSKGKEKIAQ